MDAPSGTHGGVIGAAEQGPISPPPMALCVCCPTFDDSTLEEEPDEGG